MAYTADEIACEVGMHRTSVVRKLKNIRPAYQQSNGGRPVNYYDSSVLSMFCVLDMPEPSVQVMPTELRVVDMKKENPCKNKSRILSEQLNDMLIKETYSMFMAQGDHNGLKRVCEDLIANYWLEIENDLTESGKIKNSKGKVRDCEDMQHYWYFKVINRQDKVNAGVAVRENWKLRWAEKHNFNKANARKATARYSMLEILENEGLIAPGRGAGAIWVIDGTQFDAWTDDNGKPKTFNYLMIMDGVTKLPLYVKILEDGEKISEVAEALWECVNMHGVPPLGIVADNGRAFKSKEIQAMVRAWYTPEQLEHFRRGCPIRRELYRDASGKPQRGAILYPLAKVPRAPFKASIERSFKELNRHQQTMLAVSYSGTRDSMYLTHELGTTPTVAVKHAINKQTAFLSFLHYIYFDYAVRVQPGSENLKWLKTKYKVNPTPANAWKFYGGKWEIETPKSPKGTSREESTPAPQEGNLRVLNLESESRLALNAMTAIPFFEFARADKRHKVRCGDNYVNVTHNRESHTYTSECLDARTWGKEATVVVDSYNSRRGYIFYEKEMTQKERELAKADGVVIDQSESIEFWGIGESTKISNFAQIADVRKRTSNARKAFKQEIEAYDMELMGKPFEYRTQAADNLKQLSYAESEDGFQFADCQVLDADAQPKSPKAEQLLSSENLPKGKEAFGRYEEADMLNLLDITDLMSGM